MEEHGITRALRLHRDTEADAAFANATELAIHRRVSRRNYSRRRPEASAVPAHMKQGIHLDQGMEMGYGSDPSGVYMIAKQDRILLK